MKKNILFLLGTLALTYQILPAACAPDDDDDDASALQELTRVTDRNYGSAMRRSTSAPESVHKPTLAILAEEDEEEQQEEPVEAVLIQPTVNSLSATPSTMPTIEELTTTLERLKANLLGDPYFEIGLYKEPLTTNLPIILKKNYLKALTRLSDDEPRRSEIIADHLSSAIATLTHALDQRDPLRLQALEEFFATHPKHGSQQSFEKVKTHSHPLLTLPILYQYLIAAPRALEEKTIYHSSKKQVVRAGSVPAAHADILKGATNEAFLSPTSARSSRSSSIKFAEDPQLEAVETFETDLDYSVAKPRHPLFPIKAKRDVQEELLKVFAEVEEEKALAQQMKEEEAFAQQMEELEHTQRMEELEQQMTFLCEDEDPKEMHF